jgi:hypothetical protein
MKRKFKSIIGVTSVFFAFTVYLASIPLSEFCNIHLNPTAVGRHDEAYLELL